MSNQLMVTMAQKFGVPEAEMMITLKATAFKGQVSDAQMTALLIVAGQYGLNPWLKEIYAFPDKGGIIPIVGVDGWSRIINENPAFDGMEFRQSEKMVKMQGAKGEAPEWMECVMYRKDRSHPIVVREYLSEVYREPYKKDGRDVIGPWQTHTCRFLRHKTMIQCARVAFGYTGIFDEDEAERIIEKDITPTVDRAPALAKIQACNTMDELIAVWKSVYAEHGADKIITMAKDAKKAELSQPVIEAPVSDFAQEIIDAEKVAQNG